MLKPLHTCNKPGCTTLTRGSYCDSHVRRSNTEGSRPTAYARGYDYKWRQARKLHLRKSPWCVACLVQGRRTLATVVDHVTPHKGNKELFWDRTNWQSLCERCHGIKTVASDGGFGRQNT